MRREPWHSRVDAQQFGVGQLEAGEDGRGAKRRARLAAAVGAVADVQGQRLRQGRLEADGAALALRVHSGRVGLGFCLSGLE